jgi:hypothetical protein
MVSFTIQSFVIRGIMLLLLILLGTGCMYRGEIERQQANPAFVREELSRVSSAVEQYYKARSVYPIKNSELDTPLYEKYIIDLHRLVQAQMLSAIPQNAFETGGSYYYLLLHPETEPSVRLMDIEAVQQTADIQKAVGDYALANGGRLPLGAEIGSGFFAIDYKALGRKPLQIQSGYSNQYLPLLLHSSGEIVIDYSLDIMKAVQEIGREPKDGEDAREILAEASPFAPVRSYPYLWENGEPKLSIPSS